MLTVDSPLVWGWIVSSWLLFVFNEAHYKEHACTERFLNFQELLIWLLFPGQLGPAQLLPSRTVALMPVPILVSVSAFQHTLWAWILSDMMMLSVPL
jgi:hypothetical protein